MWLQKIVQTFLILMERSQSRLLYIVIPVILTVFIQFPLPWSFFEKNRIFPVVTDFIFWLIVSVVAIQFIKKFWKQLPL